MVKPLKSTPDPQDAAVTWKAQDRIKDGGTVVHGSFKCSDRNALREFTEKLEGMGIKVHQSISNGMNMAFQVNGNDLQRNGISYHSAEVSPGR